jgi:hypothetical protein
LNDWQEVKEKAGSFSTPPGSSLPDHGSTLEVTRNNTVEVPGNTRQRRTGKTLREQFRHNRNSRFASIFNRTWKDPRNFLARSKHFQPTMERNLRLDFEPISRSWKRSLKRNPAGRLGIETISTRDRRRLEGAMENPARKFPGGRIRLLSRFLILEMISRYRLEALPTSRQIQAAMRLSRARSAFSFARKAL